ncbi:MAG: tRNA dihydrouridine synthase DusB [Planctomycetaceae bacterium]|nr:tRNA dihydrouridine synthase DusB [Planctomycetaceae bacterium]
MPVTLQYGSLTLPTRYLLSPLAGFTNLPFRRVVREVGGVGLCTTDLVSARALLAGSRKSMKLIETCAEDSPLSVQIFGSDPRMMHDAAQYLQERGIASIDINMGCPVQKIVGGGAGSAMMCRRDETIDLVKTVVESVSLPVTVKMRLGWDDENWTAPFFAREFEQVGVAAIAIHGRTREQGFRGSVKREGIRQVVEAVENIPVIGNGDILNVADAQRMFAETGCHGISIGRGALANPWIFQQLVDWETTGTCRPSGTFDERLRLMLRQLDFQTLQLGEDLGIRLFRKMGHWYLKGMRVPASLRHDFQNARTRDDVNEVVERITQHGPQTGDRNALPDMHIPVPSGPVDKW